MAQPADPMDSVADVPSGAPAQAASCWPMTAMPIELSAAAPICWPRADATAMAPATATARRLRVGLGNLTDRDLEWTDRTSAAHLEGRLWPKQTTALIQGGRACRTDSPHLPMAGKSRAHLGRTTSGVTTIGPAVRTAIGCP